jgi:broad specificity phosphatase PhoE
MDEIVLARHGESEASARGIVGGDTPLTAAGRSQAQALARALEQSPIDLCLTSDARRALETASLALAGRETPIEVLPELRDARFGAFEGRPLAEYREWTVRHPPATIPPGGGESRVATMRRLAVEFRRILARPSRFVLLVAHGLTLSAVLDPTPRPFVYLPYGALARLQRAELDEAVTRLERWCEAPAW